MRSSCRHTRHQPAQCLQAFLMACFGALLAMTPGYSQANSPPKAAGNHAVVVELFTSQGCSSCPPADEVLRKIGNDKALKDKIIPLSFHVDYWDYIGWKDPFASPRWSNRQRRYGKIFQSKSIYTPQAVIHGRTHAVGSHESTVMTQVNAASAIQPGAESTLSLTWDKEGNLVARIGARMLQKINAGKAQVALVVFENGLSRKVHRGENHGRTLKHDFVVREFKHAFHLSGEPGPLEYKTITLTPDPSWKKNSLGAVVLVQDAEKMTMFNASVAYPSKP